MTRGREALFVMRNADDPGDLSRYIGGDIDIESVS